MRLDLDPCQMTPDERRREVAVILATGLRRLRDRAALIPVAPAENPAEQVENRLEHLPTTALNVHTG